jgi:hypothetical protein
LTIWIVFKAVKLLNYFPPKGGIADIISPRTIMTGETLNYKTQLNLRLGQYCQVHEEGIPRNGQHARAQGAICLGPSGNQQGRFKFMSLATSHSLSRRTWDILPMPNSVIDRVNTLGKYQPELFIFTDCKGHPIGDIEPLGPDDDLDNATNGKIPVVNAGVNDTPQVTDGIEIDITQPDNAVIDPQERIEVDIVPDIVPDDNLQVEQSHQLPSPGIPIAAAIPAPIEVSAPDKTAGVRRSTRVKFQPKQDYVPSMSGSSKYAYTVTQLETQGVLHPYAHMFFQRDMYRAEPDVAAAIMTQLSLKAGLKAWGGKAQKAVHSEMKQLHFRDTFNPMRWNELTHAQKQSVLESHLFLKEKRTGEIKGRTVAGGNKQRDLITKEEATSPTVATKAVLSTCIIDADEGRYVAVIDTPNAFIQTKIEDEKDMAIIKIRGILVDMLLDIAPNVYTPFVTLDRKGVKQVIVQCLNAIYGTTMASLLYYQKCCTSLLSKGFVFDDYDPCVANKQIGGNQMTICFHVDDCKLSHKSLKVMDQMITWLRQEYESIFEDGSGKMSVSRGMVHTYLGMKLDFTLPGRVKITMLDYVEEIIVAFEKADPEACGTKTSAAPTNLFTVDGDCKKLSAHKATQFQNIVAKTLYATKRARPNTCTPVAFLTTHVRGPGETHPSHQVPARYQDPATHP